MTKQREATENDTGNGAGTGSLTIEEITEGLSALQAENARLVIEVERLKAGPAANGKGGPNPRRRGRRTRGEDGVGPTGSVSRRRMFGLLGGAATGLAVAGSTLGAAPAGAAAVTTGAADGDALAIGEPNTNSAGSANATALSGSTNGPEMLRIAQSGTNTDFALQAYHNGTGTTAKRTALFGFRDGVVGGTGGTGVQAQANTIDGVGLTADSTAGAAILLTDHTQTIPPTTGTWTAGSLVQTGGQLWYCTQSGTGSASKWVQLSTTGSKLITLASPVRVYDSRPGANPTRGGSEDAAGGG